MRTDQDQPVRLADYQPPGWLVETVHLDVALDATATRVRARLKVRPNPTAPAIPIAPNARRRAFAASPISPTGPT